MTYLIIGTALLVVGALFFWLNNNSPIQTGIPAFTLPIGAILFVVGLARMLP